MMPWLVLAAVLSTVLAFGGGYWKGGHDKASEVKAQVARDAELLQSFDTKLAERISAIQVKHVRILQRAEKEIIRVPEYRDCVAQPDGLLQLVNEALTGTPPGTDRSVPAADTAGTGAELH